MADGFQITVTSKNLKLDKYALSAERYVLQALDVIAAEVQEHIRSGHPKVSNATLRQAARGDDQGYVLDKVRERTGLASGEFKGMLRWLTRTGATRNSVFITKAKASGSGFTRVLSSSVASAQKHINDLEFGTATRRAFPAFRPAVIAKGPRGNFLLRDALLRAAASL